MVIVKLVQVMLLWGGQKYCGNCETGASDVTVVGSNIVVIVKLEQVMLLWGGRNIVVIVKLVQ